MAGRLETVLGEPEQAGTTDQRAQNILDALKYGYNIGFACGLPQVFTGHWGVLRVMEKQQSEEAPPPFERLAVALAGLDTTMEVAVSAEAGGIGLSVGFMSAGDLSRARLLLAPGCLIEPCAAPALPRAAVVGVTNRVQSAAGEVSATRFPLSMLDRLDGISGPWTLFLHCESVPMTDVMRTTLRLDMYSREAATYLNVTQQLTDTTTSNSESHEWRRVMDWLGVVAKLLSQGGGTGLWTVDCWALAGNASTAVMVASALHAAIPSDQGRWYETLDYDEAQLGDPPPTSALTSRDLGYLLAPPRVGKPGLPVREAPPGGHRPSTAQNTLRLGHYAGTEIGAYIGLEDLEGHAFVTGTTGSGKSTTLHRLLAGLWNEHGIPFLVLDPVKDDYSAVSSYFKGGIQIVRGADIHMNLLEAWPDEDLRGHISQVASAFRGSFSMPSPTPYVVTQLFDKVAMLPSGGAGMSLFDVRDMVPSLITSLGYAPEQESNIRAALMTRLNLLLAPARAHRFSWTDSRMVLELFKRPSVVTLGDLTDDEERSFVVILLAMATWAMAKNRKKPRAIEHVLVLEEAHRILPEVNDQNVDPEIGSAKQVSSEMLSAMMAEVRSYGEQIIVVDQSPSRVSSDVSRNTNLKIAHRVVHPEDQTQVAGMLGLPEGSESLLGELQRGNAIYTTRTEPNAQTVAVEMVTDKTGPASPQVVKLSPAGWPCGTSNIEAHYRAWQSAAAAARPMSLFLAGVLWGEGDGKKLRERVYRDLLEVAEGDQALTDCLAWAGLRQLTSRRRLAGPGSGPNSAESQLDALYQMWDGRLPVTKIAAEGIVAVPPVSKALAGKAYLTWEERAITDAMLNAEPRDGLRTLRGVNWRSELPRTVDYIKGAVAAYEPMLGDGTDRLFDVLIRAAVTTSNLTFDVAEELMTRTGISPKKTP